MAEKRKQERDIEISPCEDTARRERLEQDTCEWLRYYFPDIFYNPFTDDHREMIDAIEHAARYSGDQGIAAPRGDGKTKFALFVSLKLVMVGMLMFPVVVSKSGKIAERELKNLKDELLYNERLAADYPEVCGPIRELEGSAARARLQTVKGRYTRIVWNADHIILPTVEGSRASGRIIASVGIDGAIRGMNFRNVRPDLALIDDIDDRESAKSEKQTADRCQIIDEDIAGLAGQGKRVSRLMLCTLLNNYCAAAKFTDRTLHPSFKGKRFGMVKVWPAAMDKWKEYVRLRRDRDPDADPNAREAHRYYLEHRGEMDAGSIVSNEHRFVSTALDDGEPAEVSALQSAFNIIADTGQKAFDTEYQNAPPIESGPEDNGITAAIVRSRLNGVGQRVVPRICTKTTSFIDLGARWIHWSRVGWAPGAVGFTVDYGRDPVIEGDRIAREEAILMALRDRREAWEGDECLVTEDGEVRDMDLCLIDAGNWQSTAYKFCEESGAVYQPSMGLAKYRDQKKRPGIEPGDNWYWSRQKNGGPWVVDMNHDHWVRWLHERFLTDPLGDDGAYQRGAMTLFGNSQAHHSDFSKHMTSEVWRVEFVEGKGEKGAFYKSGPNHWLDTMYGNCVAGSVLGIRLLPASTRLPPRRGRSRPWFSNPHGSAYLASQR